MPIFGKKNPEDMKDQELLKKGATAFSQQNWEEASEFLRVYVKRKPYATDAREYFAVSLIHSQKVEEALEHCMYLVDRDPKNPMYHLHLGSCYQLQGKIDDAIEEYALSLELQEDPKIRGLFLYLKNPTIPLLKIETADSSASSVFARMISNLEFPEDIAPPEFTQAASELSELGRKQQDEIMDRKDPQVFMKEIADACIEKNWYVGLNDLLRKFKHINEVKKQLGLLKSRSGIKGWIAEFNELQFVQFERIESN